MIFSCFMTGSSVIMSHIISVVSKNFYGPSIIMNIYTVSPIDLYGISNN